MNKRKLHHAWVRFRAVKPWYFLILAIISGVICIFALRNNNEQMLKLRDAVYSADKDNGNTEEALQNLRAYVTAHMNTDLSTGNGVYPPVQLKYTYDRLVQARSSATSDQNQKIYSDAQKHCEQQNSTDFSGRNRVPCIQQYVQSHTAVGPASNVPDALYKFSFVSPKWSPDVAGWSLIATIVLFICFVVSGLAHLWFKHQLKKSIRRQSF